MTKGAIFEKECKKVLFNTFFHAEKVDRLVFSLKKTFAGRNSMGKKSIKLRK